MKPHLPVPQISAHSLKRLYSRPPPPPELRHPQTEPGRLGINVSTAVRATVWCLLMREAG
jgi:hypothetical protein